MIDRQFFAHFVRIQSQSWWRAAMKMRMRKNFRTKKNLASLWSRSGSKIRIRIRIRDSNPDSIPDSNPDSIPDSIPDPKPDPDPKLTSGRIRIRNGIRNFCFESATLLFAVHKLSPNTRKVFKRTVFGEYAEKIYVYMEKTQRDSRRILLISRDIKVWISP